MPSHLDCDALDAICTETFSTVPVTWQPFTDLESVQISVTACIYIYYLFLFLPSHLDCDALDAICTETFSTVSVTWQPFTDLESGIVR